MIDFSTILLDLSGEPIKDNIAMQINGGLDLDLTLGRAASHALCASYPDENNLGGDEKFRRGLLACKVYPGGQHELSPEDVTLLKKLVAKAYSPIVVIKAWPLLDPTLKDK